MAYVYEIGFAVSSRFRINLRKRNLDTKTNNKRREKEMIAHSDTMVGICLAQANEAFKIHISTVRRAGVPHYRIYNIYYI